VLLCETGGASPRDIEDLAVFVSQLNALGVPARIHARSVPAGLHRNTQFDLAPFLAEAPPAPSDRVVLIAAERLSDQRLVELRRLAGRSGARCLAIGAFGTHQATIGARAKLSYVFGVDPELLNLAQDGAFDVRSGAPVVGVPCPPAGHGPPGLLLVDPPLEELAQARALMSLALSRNFRAAVVTDGKTKQEWIAAHGPEVPIYQYGDCLPASLASRVRICVIFATHTSYRVQSLIANLAARGAVLLDGTPTRAFAGKSDAFIAGPVDLATLSQYLQFEIQPNLDSISEQVKASDLARTSAPDGLLLFLREPAHQAAPRRRPAPEGPPRVVFMPTNGIGLGHAQRSALLASELDSDRVRPVFAAFPSCLPLIKSYGFDVAPLIGRSEHHAQSHENDLANYLRLRALTAGARALVFDGTYVFDSVCRSILDHGLAGIWIRRGLWQAAQSNVTALDREKLFERVIVPSEAFEELNGSYSRGDQLRAVGPIVQQVDLDAGARDALRQRLAARFGLPFDRLVVSLLGAGVAADRSAQIQAICGMMQRRSDVLHLVVVWPTATLQPAWFAWGNSRVVRTTHAALLIAAADLCVSAAGYNSFHEILYTGAPAIFVPQMQSYMDDQRARARAAGERGLAAVVEAGQLMTLEREIGRFLDAGEGAAARARIAALDLPARGNARAARLIEEVTVGYATLDRGARPRDRARGR
jgi:hypothetical protein